MKTWDIYKNVVKVAHEDAAGITNTNGAGERILGTDYFTGAELADEDEVLTRRRICPRCLYPIKYGEPLIKQKSGYHVCSRCADKERY